MSDSFGCMLAEQVKVHGSRVKRIDGVDVRFRGVFVAYQYWCAAGHPKFKGASINDNPADPCAVMDFELDLYNSTK